MKSKVLVVLLLFSFQIFEIFTYHLIEVSAECGKIRGSTLKTRGGREICSFKGIPFAKPPIDNLRFKAPESVDPWVNVLKATEDAPLCPQLKNGTPVGQEDCLYLNVFTPSCSSNPDEERLPVLFFIHGGRWEVGTSNSSKYGPEFLLDEDIVFVVASFRVGVLGFLSTGDSVASGNWGLKDQVMALRWVSANIEDFGGDPNRVTIMGDSKGGAAVQALFYSPQSQGLVERGISLSGVFQNPYSFAPVVNVTTPSRKLARLVGCPSEPSTELLKCMRTINFNTLVKHQSQVYPNNIVPPSIDTLWAPVIEGKNAPDPFLTFDIRQAPTRPRFPWMVGLNAGDGGVYVGYMFGVGSNFEIFLRRLRENPKLVLPLILQLDLEFCREDIPAIMSRILEFYFCHLPVDETTKVPLVDLFSDYFFFTGAVNAALSHNGPAYFFEYAYNQSVSFNMLRGDKSLTYTPTHEDILLSLFPDKGDFPSRTYSAKDTEISKKIVKIVASFVQNKHSSDRNFMWEPINAENNMEYLYMGNDFIRKHDFLHHRLSFWKNLRAEFRTKSLTNSQVC